MIVAHLPTHVLSDDLGLAVDASMALLRLTGPGVCVSMPLHIHGVVAPIRSEISPVIVQGVFSLVRGRSLCAHVLHGVGIAYRTLVPGRSARLGRVRNLRCEPRSAHARVKLFQPTIQGRNGGRENGIDKLNLEVNSRGCQIFTRALGVAIGILK